MPLLAKHGEPSENDVEILIRKGERTGGARIRCPKCAWVPRREDRWGCRCGHAWNTFDTGGKCPGCGFQWSVTQCLRCKEYSPHLDWYVREPGQGEPQS
jgi:hypothetical protein